RAWDVDKAKLELSFLDNADEPLPATLPMCAQAIARRIQLDIVREELPNVRQAIAWDTDDGADVSVEAHQFCMQFDQAPKPLSAAEAISLFRICEVGREKLSAETGSDLLARTATQAVAVGASAVGSQASGLPKVAQHPLKTLRGIALMVYAVV